MKPLLLAFALSLAAMAAQAARTDVRVFQIQNAKFDAGHGSDIKEGTVTVDYAAKTVKLEAIRPAPVCQVGMLCAQYLPAPLVVELPITSMTDDSCGIHQITAQKDDRPADGALQEIKLEDVVDMTCQTFAAVVAHASYRTVSYSRLESKDIEQLSTMELVPKTAVVDPPPVPVPSSGLSLANAILYRGFAVLDEAKDGSIEIGKDTVVLKIAIDVKCPSAGPCPKSMAKLISENLTIVSQTEIACGHRIVARLISKEAPVSKTYLDVYDYRGSACKRKIDHPVKALYRKQVRSSGRISEQAAFFSFDQK